MNDEITLQEIRNAQALMEAQIFETVQASVKAFHDKTGLWASQLSITLMEYHPIGQRRPNYVPTSVDATIDLA
jgi:hypothetical protein